MIETGASTGRSHASTPAATTNGTVCATVERVHRRPVCRRARSVTGRRQWTPASWEGVPPAPAGAAAAGELIASTSGDRPAQDHERRVERELANLLGAAFTLGDHREIALVELRAERGHRGRYGCGVLRSPLGHRGVAGLIHPDESGHFCLLETGDASLIVRRRASRSAGGGRAVSAMRRGRQAPPAPSKKRGN